ncbi:MAG: GNAT family N-acetyltransferase, partial [Actinomycetota bacterium]|nr:GNAT family N-acetyltransferase [Actinomycetota bacterium]
MGWSSHGGEDLVEVSPGFTMSGGRMSVQHRLAMHSDYDHEAIVRIGRAIRPDGQISPADLRDWDANQHRAGRVSARWVAFVTGTVVGSGSFSQTPWFEPTTFYTHVMVHPDHQGHGHGRSLAARVEASASERGARRLLGQVDEREKRAIRFVEEAGFREIDRWRRSTLDLTRFDPRSWEPILEGVAGTGIRIVSVADLRETRPGWKQDLHRLYVDVETDAPSHLEIREVPFADFEARSLGRQLLADGFLLAMDGDEMIGLTEPQPVDDDPVAIA